MVRAGRESVREKHQIQFILHSIFVAASFELAVGEGLCVRFFQAQDCENVRVFMNDNYVHHHTR